MERERLEYPRSCFVDCKVLLTPRIQEVAEIGISHKLNFLNEEEGWQLLDKKALTGKNATDANIQAKREELGKEMVHKCGYLPLAVSVIGGILSKKESLQEWEMVNKDIDSYLRFSEGVEDNDRVMQILNLSYEDLPYQLKPCLLYLAHYPEDAEINLQNLYLMWIAEGMILSKDRRCNESLMEVAKRYLTVLASRSLVQVQLNEETWSIHKSCRLHDLICDLSIRKCEEEDFLMLMDFRESKQQNLNPIGSNAYRLVIYASGPDTNAHDKILQEANKGTRAYSLRRSRINELPNPEISRKLRNLQFLRIVTFENVNFSDSKVLRKVIKKLIHLRYISFDHCNLDEVPSSIAKLTYLQTFHLSFSSSLKVKIPNVFWKLERLVHFVLRTYTWSASSRKLRLDFPGGLENLIIFSEEYFVNDEGLTELTNLRVFELDVNDNENLSLIISCLESKWRNIRHGALRILGGCDLISKADGPILLRKLFSCRAHHFLEITSATIRELPRYEIGMLASSDLVELEFWGNHIEEDPMPTLGKLPKLKRLHLNNESFNGEELICSSTGFPNLEVLWLGYLINLKRWRIDDGAMPNLSSVLIRRCYKLEIISLQYIIVM